MTSRLNTRRSRPRRLVGALLLAGACLWGCAAGGGGALGHRSSGPRLGIIPFENLSERTDAGDVATRIATERLAERGGFSLIEAPEMDGALEELRIRASGAIPREQLIELGRKLGARYFLTGAVLENGVVRTGDGDVPSIGLSVELIEASDGHVAWRRMKFRTGDDHETLFGWGRVTSAQKLTADLMGDLIAGLPSGAADSAASAGGEKDK